ncbi:hypothetical protein T265_08217 [Opisthorchis viverrini]|uniref:Uncharacterized protein n=1 Tax=Opisthorchis viverrini TaxID=6198 RepID=A0A074ZL14_OPIVI|nr:hypothetical protein T265_08217 [Opisthorchis viverrini]KER24050.1 hypothetical protein T265_08217 [Opisthorchis viverrini]
MRAVGCTHPTTPYVTHQVYELHPHHMKLYSCSRNYQAPMDTPLHSSHNQSARNSAQTHTRVRRTGSQPSFKSHHGQLRNTCNSRTAEKTRSIVRRPKNSHGITNPETVMSENTLFQSPCPFNRSRGWTAAQIFYKRRESRQVPYEAPKLRVSNANGNVFWKDQNRHPFTGPEMHTANQPIVDERYGGLPPLTRKSHLPRVNDVARPFDLNITKQLYRYCKETLNYGEIHYDTKMQTTVKNDNECPPAETPTPVAFSQILGAAERYAHTPAFYLSPNFRKFSKYTQLRTSLALWDTQLENITDEISSWAPSTMVEPPRAPDGKE